MGGNLINHKIKNKQHSKDVWIRSFHKGPQLR